MPLGPASRLPIPLLGFLDIPSQGRYPDRLEESIRPTIEISELMAVTSIEYITNTQNPAAFGTLLIDVVPDNEAWYVVGFGAWAQAGAAEYIQLQQQLTVTLAGNPWSWALGQWVSTHPGGAAGAGQCYSGISRPFWAPPRGRLYTNVMRIITAANIAVNSTVGFIRIPV